MHFFPCDIFTSNIQFFYSSLMIIFKYFITVFVTYILSSEIYLSFTYCLFHHQELCILDRILFWVKILFFSSFHPFRSTSLPSNIFYPFRPTVFQPYWKICEFLKSQILMNQCSNIVPGTQSDILIQILLKVSIFRRHNFVFRNKPKKSLLLFGQDRYLAHWCIINSFLTEMPIM